MLWKDLVLSRLLLSEINITDDYCTYMRLCNLFVPQRRVPGKVLEDDVLFFSQSCFSCPFCVTCQHVAVTFLNKGPDGRFSCCKRSHIFQASVVWYVFSYPLFQSPTSQTMFGNGVTLLSCVHIRRAPIVCCHMNGECVNVYYDAKRCF